MITQYVICIESIPGHPLYAESAYRLYAHLLEQLPQEEAIWLHQTGGRGISQFLQYDKENKRYVWTMNILLENAAAILRPVLDSLQEVSIENQAFPILNKAIREVTLESLLRQGREETGHRTTIFFCTQTAFKQNDRYVIFPQERLILQSLITRWNEVFPMCSMEDEDAFHAVLAGNPYCRLSAPQRQVFLKKCPDSGFHWLLCHRGEACAAAAGALEYLAALCELCRCWHQSRPWNGGIQTKCFRQ